MKTSLLNSFKLRHSSQSASSAAFLCVIAALAVINGLFAVHAKDFPLQTNFIKSFLTFNTASSPGWSTDDTAHTRLASDYSLTNFTIQTKCYLVVGGAAFWTCPYEYIYTNTPPNSSVSSTDMEIYEVGTLDYKYYQGTTLFSHPTPPAPQTTFYTPPQYCNYTTVVKPANPTEYAADSPGGSPPIPITQSNMASMHCDSFVGTRTLTSYPLYKDPTAANLQASEKKVHTFTYTCTSVNTNGSGPYSWTVSY